MWNRVPQIQGDLSLVYVEQIRNKTITIKDRNTMETIEIKDFYNSGNLLYSSVEANGKKQGKEIWYYENGQIKCERVWVDGKINGTETLYFEDGSVKMTHNYIDGKLDGEEFWYYENGEMKGKVIWDKDKLIKEENFTEYHGRRLNN